MKQKFLQFGTAPKITSRRMGMSADNSHRKAAYRSDGDDDEEDEDDEDDSPKVAQRKIIKKLKSVSGAIAKAATTADLDKKVGDTESKVTKALGEAKADLEKVIGEVRVIADEADKRSKELDKKAGQFNIQAEGQRTFGMAFREGLAEKRAEFNEAMENKKSFRLQLKDVSVMTTGTHLTGNSVVSYAPQAVLKPSQKIKFRDLIPTVPSPTGVYATYRETGGEGNPDWQSTQGQTKPKMDIKFTEEKKSSEFLAATVDFAEQLSYNLPFLENTLPRWLLREFFKKESKAFYDKVKAVQTGGGTTVETDKVKKIIDFLTYQADADYETSYILMANRTLGTLNKALLTGGQGYGGLAGVVSMPDGSLMVGNTTIVPASFVPLGEVMIIDADYLERIETKALAIDFSRENKDNFEKNVVTARIECYETLNILDPAAHAWKVL